MIANATLAEVGGRLSSDPLRPIPRHPSPPLKYPLAGPEAQRSSRVLITPWKWVRLPPGPTPQTRTHLLSSAGSRSFTQRWKSAGSSRLVWAGDDQLVVKPLGTFDEVVEVQVPEGVDALLECSGRAKLISTISTFAS